MNRLATSLLLALLALSCHRKPGVDYLTPWFKVETTPPWDVAPHLLRIGKYTERAHVNVGGWHQVYEYSSRDSTAGFQVLQGQQHVLVKEPRRIYREGRIEPIQLDSTLCPRNGIDCRGGHSLVCLHVERSKTNCSQIHLTEYNFDGQLLTHRSANSPQLDGQCLWRGSDDDVLAQTIVGFDRNAQPVVAIATTRPPEAYYSLLQIDGEQPVELATLAKRMDAGIDVHRALEWLKLAAPRCSTDRQ